MALAQLERERQETEAMMLQLEALELSDTIEGDLDLEREHRVLEEQAAVNRSMASILDFEAAMLLSRTTISPGE